MNRVIYLGNSKNPKYNTGFAYGVWSLQGVCPALTCMGGVIGNHLFWLSMIYSMIQLVGDRDAPSLSIKPYAFSVCANPMSDRNQMILIEYAEI